MVNFGLNTASFLGIILAVAGAGLYFLRSVRPELSRDQDIAFTAIGIICGFILIFQGWRLDPILQFGQLLLSGSAIYFAYESIKLRGIANDQAKEKSQIVDERPVSRRYKAEIEDRELDERPRNSRRIKGDNTGAVSTGRENRRSNRRDDEESEDFPRRRANSRQLEADGYAPETTTRRRRTEPARNVSSLARRNDDRWDDEDDWNETDDAPVPVRRALPDADLANNRSTRSTSSRRREEREDDPAPTRSSRSRDVAVADDVDTAPRRRRPRSVGVGDSLPLGTASAGREKRPENPSTDRASTGSGEGSTANYVDYEPIDPPSGLPPSGSEPIVFPDRY
ncbi:Ycf66 family protein [Chamaesiphon sp. VAR_48_metabat_403]|uniref:Ycf66 family protein n=1 Tax=Chamaesiphon sp. VAR_48_metabat_403 TaxID=2964700 RepID=UPI00286DC19D|nr:Ycf66 family protein [Chamaesiphon sp. VAR_48_metabat_403]